MNKIVTSGKRKTSVARAIVTEGSGKILINKKDHNAFSIFEKLRIEEPLRIYQKVVGKLNFDANISVRGGGEKSRIGASRLALAKALVEFSKSKELKKELMNYDKHLLIADVRRKETYKPGDSKARSMRQSSKR